MTNETKQRIRYYKRALPAMREKVVAALMMLLIAATTVAASTYAWLTISASPEVTSVDTTVAANGALEIALANGTGAAPGKSREGDSTGAGTPITAANITWGNLVNLTDPSYGLANVTLRPAALNSSNLLSNPLYGVGYGEDGRVTEMVTGDQFRYAYFDPNSGDDGMFLIDTDNQHLGIRAISSVQYENTEGTAIFRELLSAAESKLKTAGNNYISMTTNPTYISSLEGLMSVYAQSKADKKNVDTLEVTDYVENLYDMMLYYMQNVMYTSGESYVQMANTLEMITNGNADAGYTVDTLIAAALGNKLPLYISEGITSLPEFAQEYTTLQSYMKTGTKGDFSDLTAAERNKSLAYWAYQAKNGTAVYWKNIKGLVNYLCDIENITLNGIRLGGLGIGTAMDLMNQQPIKAVIHEKASLYKTEKRIGANMNTDVVVTVRYYGTNTLKAIMSTSAEAPFGMDTDIETIRNLKPDSFKGGTATAQDTYALAIDLWLRTNAGSDSTVQTTRVTSADGKTVTTTDPLRAYLTLEGKVRYRQIETRATVTVNGETYDAFTASYKVDNKTLEMTVYQHKDGTDTYYWLDDDGKEQVFTVSGATYTPKMNTETIVDGYDGVNRVWSGEQMTPYEGDGTSTTQGGGSCYTFYASNAADQSRFLELLGSVRVAFIDANGRLIGAATMDTQHYYAENGKVTVPLALDATSAINLGDDGSGNTTYALMQLTKNAATRVTAIVYLDGTKLTNEMVLASGDIQGNLNVQFGCSVVSKVTTVTTTTDETGSETTKTDTSYERDADNEAIENEELMDDKIQVTAAANPTAFEYDPDTPAETNLTVNVTGVTPKTVEVCFLRAISKTQGVQQKRIALTAVGDAWTGKIQFEKPGNYVLRTVWVDGVEYDLNQEPITVTVTGSSVNSLTCDALPAGSMRASIMTADTSFTTKMTLGFTTSAQVPSSVKGIFMDENGRQVNVPFTLTAGTWQGTAKFTTSGTYTMQYVEIDGEQYELAESLQPTLELMLGLKVETKVSASAETLEKLRQINENALPTRFVYDPSKKDASGNPLLADGVTLTVSARIFDNSGNEIKALNGARLYYGRAGSATGGLDTDLKWSGASGSYLGSFRISGAGTFRFTKLTVDLAGKTSALTAKTTAPDIQVMPPDDAYYFGNYTDEYQYVPTTKGVLQIGIAYSSAATGVEATLTDGSGTKIVTGEMGGEAPDQGEKSVNLWSFEAPSEGEWTLKSVKLYGVYYNGTYYDDETGVTVDLSSQSIKAKIVKNLYISIRGKSQSFTGKFITDHPVSGLTVTIEDYAGMPIQGREVTGVTVNYRLNGNKVSADTYGYTADNLGSVIHVSGTGTKASGSDTVYDISELNFRQAGPYESCEVKFNLGGEEFVAGETGTIVKYFDDGKPSERCPQFDVKWEAPDVQIYFIMQPYMEDGGCNVKYTSIPQKDMTDVYSASVWWQRDSTTWYYPQVKLILNNIDIKYLTNCSTDLELKGTTSPEAKEPSWTRTFIFTKDRSTDWVYLGKIDGDDDKSSGSRGSGQYRTPVDNIKILTAVVDGVTYKLNIQHEIAFKITTKT